MKTENIKILLDKYWEGETTQSEEKALQNYFTNGVVADELKEYQEYFASIKNLSQYQLPNNFDDKVLASIKPKSKFERLTIIKNLLAAASVAAVFIVVSLIYWPNSDAAITQAEKQQAQQAYNETLLALQIISNKLDKGNQSISKIGVWHQVQTKFAKN